MVSFKGNLVSMIIKCKSPSSQQQEYQEVETKYSASMLHDRAADPPAPTQILHHFMISYCV